MSSVHPSKPEFLRLSKKANLVPVYREILADVDTPVSSFLKLGDLPYSYLLESVEGGEKIARYSFIGVSPSLIFKTKGKKVSIIETGKGEHTFETSHDLLFELEKILKHYHQAKVKGLPPFSGGAVGYMGYDTVRFFETIPNKNKDAMDLPESLFVFADTVFVFDHLNKNIKVVTNVRIDRFPNAEKAYDYALQTIEDAVKRLRSLPVTRYGSNDASKGPLKIESNFTKAAFEKAVQKAKQYIKKGDIFQLVLSQAFKTKITKTPFQIYRALRSINPSPYMFYLNMKDFHLVGASPEVHVRYEDGQAILRPIAGTRRRGESEAQDKRLEKELLSDPKECAEHLMLVDLGRNDLGRVCDFKSVKVTDFMVIERYSHVMHIVSNVIGKLSKGKTLFDLLRATFPAGTVSGAPKVRAMEIIDELENQRRGVYAGVVGYFSYSGNLDSCIAIRTIVVKNDMAVVQAGAGIVADSVPANEFDETVNKARALMKALEYAERGDVP